MAEKERHEQSDATKKRLADERSAREKKQAEQRDAMAGVKPTPTQDENDLAASGEHVAEHEADGSPPDPGVASTEAAKKESQAAPSSRGGYATRAAAPQPSRE